VWTSPFDRELRAAITNRNLLHLTYNNTGRIVEPHDYGVLNGEVKLLVFQLRSLDNRPSGFRVWRLLDVPKITACTVSGETFPGSRVDSGQSHHAWDILYARVEVGKTEHDSRA
jgi:hypothetical protein